MTASPTADADVRDLIAAERRELAAVLRGLPGPAWDAPSLCRGWRVREVVAHMTMPFRYSTARFAAELVRSAGRFPRMADRCARRDAAMSSDDLVSALGDNATYPWKPPGGGFAGALTHDVVHGLDITVALGTGRRVAEDRLRVVLAGCTPKTLRYFGADLSGVALQADDIDWSYGSGAPVCGAAQHLLLVMCGRSLPPGLLTGDQGARFTAG